jgi:hypothetical protein
VPSRSLAGKGVPKQELGNEMIRMAGGDTRRDDMKTTPKTENRKPKTGF